MNKEGIIARKKEEQKWVCKHGNTQGMDWCERNSCKECSEAIRKTNVLWFSRHEMSKDQLADLKRIFGEIEIHQINKTIKHASELSKEIEENDVIAIVAPLPLQQEFLKAAGNKSVIFCKNKRIISEDGKKVEFKFDGWFKIKKIEVITEQL